MSRKYGNNQAWCWLDEDSDLRKAVDVWHSLGCGEEEIIAHATDKYNAMKLVDALILKNNVEEDPSKVLTKKQVVFLQFISANCAEPWSTMADNAITWNDKDAYERLKNKFTEIYS